MSLTFASEMRNPSELFEKLLTLRADNRSNQKADIEADQFLNQLRDVCEKIAELKMKCTPCCQEEVGCLIYMTNMLSIVDGRSILSAFNGDNLEDVFSQWMQEIQRPGELYAKLLNLMARGEIRISGEKLLKKFIDICQVQIKAIKTKRIQGSESDIHSLEDICDRLAVVSCGEILRLFGNESHLEVLSEFRQGMQHPAELLQKLERPSSAKVSESSIDSQSLLPSPSNGELGAGEGTQTPSPGVESKPHGQKRACAGGGDWEEPGVKRREVEIGEGAFLHNIAHKSKKARHTAATGLAINSPWIPDISPRGEIPG